MIETSLWELNDKISTPKEAFDALCLCLIMFKVLLQVEFI